MIITPASIVSAKRVIGGGAALHVVLMIITPASIVSAKRVIGGGAALHVVLMIITPASMQCRLSVSLGHIMSI